MTCLVVFHKVQIVTALLFIPMKERLQYPKPTFNGLFISSPLWKTIEKTCPTHFLLSLSESLLSSNFLILQKWQLIAEKKNLTHAETLFSRVFLKIFWTQTSENSPWNISVLLSTWKQHFAFGSVAEPKGTREWAMTFIHQLKFPGIHWQAMEETRHFSLAIYGACTKSYVPGMVGKLDGLTKYLGNGAPLSSVSSCCHV